MRTNQGVLYPNLYTVLVGPPSVGKTEITNRVRMLWRSLPEHHVSSANLSNASMIDELYDANRHVHNTGGTPSSLNFNSLLIPINELGVFLPTYDPAMLNTLTDLYDCKSYTERKRSKGTDVQMENCQINMFSACTPSYLNSLLPEGAWDQGFTSRVIFIYSQAKVYRPLFKELATDEKELSALSPGLRRIAKYCGEFRIEESAVEALEAWHLNDGEPKPSHPKLLYYGGRRTVQLLKLCMIASAATSPELIITLDDVHVALDWLAEAEAEMGNIFKAMGSGSNAEIIRDIWYFIFERSQTLNEPTLEESLYQFVAEKVPSYQVQTVIEVMLKSGLIERKLTQTGNAFIAKGRQP